LSLPLTLPRGIEPFWKHGMMNWITLAVRRRKLEAASESNAAQVSRGPVAIGGAHAGIWDA